MSECATKVRGSYFEWRGNGVGITSAASTPAERPTPHLLGAC